MQLENSGLTGKGLFFHLTIQLNSKNTYRPLGVLFWNDFLFIFYFGHITVVGLGVSVTAY